MKLFRKEHSESLPLLSDAKAHNPWPAILERIEICEKLSGDYVYELYNDIAWDWYVNFHKQFK